MRGTHQLAAAPVRHAATARITQQQAAAWGCSAKQAARGQLEPWAHGEGGHGGDAAWREKLEERFRAEVH